MSKVYHLFVSGMTCTSCSDTVANVALPHALKNVIKRITANYLKSQVTVEIDLHDDDDETKAKAILEKLGEAIASLGYSVGEFSQKVTGYWIKGALAGISGLTLMLLMAMGIGLPFGMIALACMSCALILFSGKDIFSTAWKRIFLAKTINMDVLFAFSALLALVTSVVGLIFPALLLPCLFDAALMIIGFRMLGRAIQLNAKQTLHQHTSFRARATQRVRCYRQQQWQIDVDVKDLRVGDRIQLKCGEIVPVNGVCQSAGIYADSSLTKGEMVAEYFKIGDQVLAGTKMVGDEMLELLITATEAESYLAQSDKAIEAARNQKSEFEKLADKIAKYVIPLLIVCAILAGGLMGYCMTPLIGLQTALYILVAACPCALGFIVPFLVQLVMSKGAMKNVLFKNGEAIERANKIDTLVFDLNGTLTCGAPSIQKEVFYANETPENVRNILVTLEQDEKHSIAQLICRSFSTAKTLSVSNKKSFKNGVSGVIDGAEYTLGNANTLREKNIEFTTDQQQLLKESPQVTFLLRNNEIIAHFLIEDALRPNAANIIASLRAQGKKIKMCTGASQESAHYYGRALGIEACDIKANCFGVDGEVTQKQKYLRSLKSREHRSIAMVGDAGNDAAALLACDLGIAINSAFADEATKNNALIEINQLHSLLIMFYIAKRGVDYIQQNLAFSLFYNVCAIIIAPILCLALGVMLNPGIAALLMIVQSSLLLANTFRFKYEGSLPTLTPNPSPARGRGEHSPGTQYHPFPWSHFRPQQSAIGLTPPRNNEQSFPESDRSQSPGATPILS